MDSLLLAIFDNAAPPGILLFLSLQREPPTDRRGRHASRSVSAADSLARRQARSRRKRAPRGAWPFDDSRPEPVSGRRRQGRLLRAASLLDDLHAPQSARFLVSHGDAVARGPTLSSRRYLAQ